jgi:hypothetical protein
MINARWDVQMCAKVCSKTYEIVQKCAANPVVLFARCYIIKFDCLYPTNNRVIVTKVFSFAMTITKRDRSEVHRSFALNRLHFF